MVRSSWYLAHEQDHTPRRWRPAVAAPVATSFATRSTALDPLPDPDPDMNDQLAAGGRLAPKPHDSGAPAGNAARALAERGKGDQAIRFDLRRQGIDAELIDSALGELQPERARAERIVSRRGAGAKTARLLASRGFDREAVELAAEARIAPER